jgi:uncharacterized protein
MSSMIRTEVSRFDQSRVTRTPQGYLRADARPTRAGIFVYTGPDGPVRELRPPEEVFAPASIATLTLAPVTDDHPAEPLSPTNTRQLAVGTVGETVTQDGDHLSTAIQIADAAVIEKVLSGEKQELSCGYVCDLDATPGVWRGERYDAIQRNIRYNHVAIVTKGRAGPENRIRLDALETQQVTQVVKYKIDGVDHDVSESAAQAMAKAEAARDAEVAQLRARADSAEAELKKAQTALQVANDPATKAAAVKARVDLERVADKAQIKADGLSDEELKRQIVAKHRPNIRLDEKPAGYLEAAFDLVAEEIGRQDTSATLAATVEQAQRSDAVPSIENIRAERMAKLANAWKSN